jgi:thioredoxin 1
LDNKPKTSADSGYVPIDFLDANKSSTQTVIALTLYPQKRTFYPPTTIMEIINTTDADIQSRLSENSKVIVKYYADWCGSCKLFAPKFKRIAKDEKYQDVTFLEVNAEQNPEARNLAKVTNLPFFATFNNGELVGSVAASKEDAVTNLLNTLYI